MARGLKLAALAAGTLAAGCAVGPDYERPPAEVPAAWQPDAPWHEAAPNDAALKGEWWTLFQDPTLNSLVERALAGNQNLRVAAARLDQARDQVTVAAADLYPWVGLSASAERGKTSANRPLGQYTVPNQATVQNNFVLGANVNYEADLFGRVRRDVEGARASAQQAEADYENTRLVLTAQLVTDYFALRELEAEIAVVRHSLELQGDALVFIRSRHDLGFATGLDLAQQQALVEAECHAARALGQPTGAIPACARHAGRHACAGVHAACGAGERIIAGDSRGAALGLAAAPTGCGVRGAFHGGRQCAHRSCARCLLSQHHPRSGVRPAQRRLAEQCGEHAIRRPEPAVVDRTLRDADAVRRRENPGQCAHREFGLRGGGGQPTARPCLPPWRRWRTALRVWPRSIER